MRTLLLFALWQIGTPLNAQVPLNVDVNGDGTIDVLDVSSIMRTVTTQGTIQVTAVAKGPNQVNLQWSAAASPGYGYLIEVQSDNDPRYASFTQLKAIPTASGYVCDPTIVWRGGSAGCTISDPNGTHVYNPVMNGVPTWVVESQYSDPQDDSPAQYVVAGLRNNTDYKFRVRTYVGPVVVYGAYSNVASAKTLNYQISYVSTTGNDNNDGSAIDDAHAWRTVSRAGGIPCGSLLLVKAGDYANEHAGFWTKCSTSKIVVQANYGDLVRLTTNTHPDWGGLLSIGGDHIVVDGINVAENGQSDYVVTVGGNYNALFNMDVGPTMIPSAYGGISIAGSHNLLYGNYVHDFGSPYVVQNGSGNGGFALALMGGPQNVVWSNHITRGAHDTGLVRGSSRNRFLNNVADGGWGMAFETVYGGSYENLFEGIIAYHPGALEAGIYKPGFEFSYRSNTLRRSIFVGGGKAIEISAYDTTVNNLVYNNVFYNFDLCYFQSHNQGSPAYDGVQVQNNICVYRGNATEIYMNNPTKDAISHNSFWKIGGIGTDFVWWQDGGGSFQYPVTLPYAEANYGVGVWSNNDALSKSAPSFAAPAAMDFHLTDETLSNKGIQVVDSVWGPNLSSNTPGAYGLNRK